MFSLFFWRRKPSAAVKPVTAPEGQDTDGGTRDRRDAADALMTPPPPPPGETRAAPHPSLARVAEAINSLPPLPSFRTGHEQVSEPVPEPALEHLPEPAPELLPEPEPPRPAAFTSSTYTLPIAVHDEPVAEPTLEIAIEQDLASRQKRKPADIAGPEAPDIDERASNAFYASNGQTFWTVRDLGDALLTMDEATFTHHVSAERNDFANWIEGCFSERTKALGEELRGVPRDTMIKRILIATTPAFGHTGEPAVVHRAAPPQEHYDDKHVPAQTWTPPVAPAPAPNDGMTDRVREILDSIKAARLEASADIGAARERFIAARTRVWQELTDEERAHVLPVLRDAYEYLRTYH